MNSSTDENNQVPELQQNLELLKKVPLFSSFPGKAVKLLAFLAERVQLAPGDPLFEEGDDYGRMFIVLSGLLVLCRQMAGEEEVIKRYRDGDFLGSFALLGPLPALFTLRAETATTVVTLNRKHFTKILEQFPETTKLSIKVLLEELYQWERRNMYQAGSCCLDRIGATVL